MYDNSEGKCMVIDGGVLLIWGSSDALLIGEKEMDILFFISFNTRVYDINTLHALVCIHYLEHQPPIFEQGARAENR